MNKIFLMLMTGLFFVTAASAQTTPATTSVSTITTTSFEVNGLKVIFKPTVKEVISVRMYFRGGNANFAASQAGIESFALKAATDCGVKSYSSNTFRDMADKYNINIGGSADYDYGYIGLNCVAKYFNEGWNLFNKAVTEPVFEESEVQLLKQKALAAVKTGETNPDDRIEKLGVQSAFRGTPYAYDPDGSEETLSRLNGIDLKNYYYKLLNKNRMFLVVAGKITRQQLEAKIKEAFANLPSAPYTPAVYQNPLFVGDKAVMEKRDLATNYMSAIMNAPVMSSPDYVPFRMGINALSGSLFGQLRTKYNLSYAPGAFSTINQQPYAMMYVSTTNPKEAARIMIDVLNRLKKSTLTTAGLRDMKSGYITTNYMKLQNSESVTGNLGEAEIMGDWNYAERMPDLINNVTPDQISKALNKYIAGLRWVYLGNEAQAVGLFN
ncbi:M16 family metallopeptidase [Mucilaginibacter terrae]|uniref:Zinc protease n=1 Tax=Mucilaginibacter terrae TaxID=1955052 RepID=A0ABU3GSL6_9SPHI|nr:pitrilysin family protein [Mucilaginibacter terrae]MDT3402758.1 zinc protease [Mucilaginibacter terrae]